VLVVAVTLVGLILAFDLRARWRDAVTVVVATTGWVVVTLALVASLSSAATSALSPGLGPAGLRPDAAPPTLWWVANGMTPKTNPVRYGGYNAVMVRAISSMNSTEATEWSRRWIRAQVQSQGASGLALFYANKAAWNWGDGMFWAWGEGRDSMPSTLPRADGLSGLVHDVNGPRGRWYPLRVDLAQGLWLALLLVAGLGALRARAPTTDELLLGLSVLGIAVFTLLFQGRSRYLLTFVPLIVSFGAMMCWRPTLRRVAKVSRSSRGGPAPG
jgi:hypothetical protein